MTTTDLWITNLSGGPSLYQGGGLFSPGADVAWVLLDFVKAGRATLHPDHADVANLQSTVSGSLLIELFVEAEKQTGKRLTERDGEPSINRINPDDVYQINFIEF
jgi:hypothetical protein